MLNAYMKPKLPESRKRGKAMSEEIVQQIKERMRVDRAFRHDLFASPWGDMREADMNRVFGNLSYCLSEMGHNT